MFKYFPAVRERKTILIAYGLFSRFCNDRFTGEWHRLRNVMIIFQSVHLLCIVQLLRDTCSEKPGLLASVQAVPQDYTYQLIGECQPRRIENHP